MQGAERVEQAPDGAEEEGGGDESDPEEDVDGAGSGVVRGVVGTEEEVEQDGECGGESQSAQDGTGGRRVGHPLEGGGQGEAGVRSAEAGGGPEQAEREEGDEERGEGTGERVEGRDGQIVLGTDAVRECGERIGRVKDHALAVPATAGPRRGPRPEAAQHCPAKGCAPPPNWPGIPDPGPSPGHRAGTARGDAGRGMRRNAGADRDAGAGRDTGAGWNAGAGRGVRRNAGAGRDVGRGVRRKGVLGRVIGRGVG